jgi:hypothetical protein
MNDRVYGTYWCSRHGCSVTPGQQCVQCACEEITKSAKELKKKHPELFKHKLNIKREE